MPRPKRKRKSEKVTVNKEAKDDEAEDMVTPTSVPPPPARRKSTRSTAGKNPKRARQQEEDATTNHQSAATKKRIKAMPAQPKKEGEKSYQVVVETINSSVGTPTTEDIEGDIGQQKPPEQKITWPSTLRKETQQAPFVVTVDNPDIFGIVKSVADVLAGQKPDTNGLDAHHTAQSSIKTDMKDQQVHPQEQEEDGDDGSIGGDTSPEVSEDEDADLFDGSVDSLSATSNNTLCAEMRDWLRALNLESIGAKLVAAKLTDFERLAAQSEEDLLKIAPSKLGLRKKLILACRKLKELFPDKYGVPELIRKVSVRQQTLVA